MIARRLQLLSQAIITISCTILAGHAHVALTKYTQIHLVDIVATDVTLTTCHFHYFHFLPGVKTGQLLQASSANEIHMAFSKSVLLLYIWTTDNL